MQSQKYRIAQLALVAVALLNPYPLNSDLPGEELYPAIKKFGLGWRKEL